MKTFFLEVKRNVGYVENLCFEMDMMNRFYSFLIRINVDKRGKEILYSWNMLCFTHKYSSQHTHTVSIHTFESIKNVKICNFSWPWIGPESFWKELSWLGPIFSANLFRIHRAAPSGIFSLVITDTIVASSQSSTNVQYLPSPCWMKSPCCTPLYTNPNKPPPPLFSKLNWGPYLILSNEVFIHVMPLN